MSSSDTVLAQSGFDAVRCRKICGITLILLDEKASHVSPSTRLTSPHNNHEFIPLSSFHGGVSRFQTLTHLFVSSASFSSSSPCLPKFVKEWQHMWLIRLPFLSFKSEAVLKNEVKKRNLFITFSFAFFKSETLVSCTMKYIRKRETHITQIHRSVLKLMQKKNTSRELYGNL